MSGTTYTLRVVNNSGDLWDMCVYQVDPDIAVSNVMSLAWFTKTASDSTTVTFKWTIDYSFVWSETGQLLPGVYFDATQVWPADPQIVGTSTKDKAGNQVGFGYKNGAFSFTSTPTPNAQQGSLYVRQDDSIPKDTASVGIGMGGSGTFAVQAKPNVNLNFKPHPVYYLAAGQYHQGEVLDIGAINNPTDVRFPANIYSMTAVLDEANRWTVSPTKGLNSRDYKRVIAQRDELAGAH